MKKGDTVDELATRLTSAVRTYFHRNARYLKDASFRGMKIWFEMPENDAFGLSRCLEAARPDTMQHLIEPTIYRGTNGVGWVLDVSYCRAAQQMEIMPRSASMSEAVDEVISVLEGYFVDRGARLQKM